MTVNLDALNISMFITTTFYREDVIEIIEVFNSYEKLQNFPRLLILIQKSHIAFELCIADSAPNKIKLKTMITLTKILRSYLGFKKMNFIFEDWFQYI